VLRNPSRAVAVEALQKNLTAFHLFLSGWPAHHCAIGPPGRAASENGLCQRGRGPRTGRPRPEVAYVAFALVNWYLIDLAQDVVPAELADR
jgi:hypothetical protein